MHSAVFAAAVMQNVLKVNVCSQQILTSETRQKSDEKGLRFNCFKIASHYLNKKKLLNSVKRIDKMIRKK